MDTNIIFITVGIIVAVLIIARLIIGKVLFNVLKKSLPPISDTEREAIDAGTLSYEQGIFKGKLDWEHLLNRQISKLSDEEIAFINGPVKELSNKLNDFDVRSEKDIPDFAWKFLKEKGFFSFIVPKQYGGLEFSAQALSSVVSILGSNAVALAVTVMVPNSLGPAKLLLKFGTKKQKDEYLPKLASGEYVPCFALTGITSGSDAASMRDVGVIKKVGGKLVIEANFSKRYITLAPIATLIGLAIDVYDPDGLLGKDYEYVDKETKHVGISVAMLKRDTDGMEIGNRHLPLSTGFMNGSIRGRNVIIEMDQIIGGQDYLGKGWMMLMACLGVGRSVSMPAVSAAGMSYATMYTMLYAGMRKQFNLPIAKMEGVMEKLADSLYLTFINDSARNLAATMVDDGENPAVASAMIKYASTEDMRTVINNCMDVLAGKAICDGPNNFIQSSYQGVPVAITVEGANILTRTLITFSQGAIRAHPYLFAEIEALYNEDEKKGRKQFSNVIMKHIFFTGTNILGNFFHNFTNGMFIGSPSGTKAPSKYYRMINQQAKQFALLSDVVLLTYGGGIKAKQILSGRCADVLKNISYAMATLKNYEDTNNQDLLPLLDYSIKRLCFENSQNMKAIIENIPTFGTGFLLKFLIFPLSIFGIGLDKQPSDKTATKVVKTVYNNFDLTNDIFRIPTLSGVLDDMVSDYKYLLDAEPIYKKLKPFLKSGELLCNYEKNWVSEALKQNLITNAEADILNKCEAIYYNRMNVDEFSNDGNTHIKDVETNLTV
ncbi:MAG: acyl-CoA dehydrogenase [Alphaproteobacteria bacterium]